MSDSTKPQDATSYHDTALGIIPRSKLIELEAEGIARGLDFIIQDRDYHLDQDLLLTIHSVCFKSIFPDWAGKYRTIDVETSTHKFPSFYKIPELVSDFFKDLQTRLDHSHNIVELIAWAHHKIVWIHPFQDYNGRTARLFSNLLMLRLNLPLVEINVNSEETRKTYVQTLKSADEGDLEPLTQLLRNALNEVVKK